MHIRKITFAAVISASVFAITPSWAQESSAPSTGIIPTPTPVITSGAPPYMEGWAGFGMTDTFKGGYVGGVVALNPTRDVWIDGFVLRGEFSGGRYDRTSSTTDDVWMHAAAFMFGYRAKVGNGMLTGYIGWNYENHQNDDPFATIRGHEAGVRGLIEYYTRITPTWDFYGQGSYSTAFDTGFLFGRSGFNIAERIWLGPEASFYRNEGSREARIGGFVRFENAFFGNGITLSGGWANDLKGDNDGFYANLNLDFQFR